MSNVAFIQGASRGIGFALVKQFFDKTSLKIVATGRDENRFKDNLLKTGLSASDPRIKFIKMDVTKEEEIKNTSDLIKKNYGSSPIQYFVNSSAFLKPEKSLSQIDKDIVLQHFNVNIIGAMLVAKHFTPLLANPKVSGNPVVWSNLSAKTGSISDNGLGGWHSYRISKAALNQLTKTMSVELGRKGIQVLSLHPGTVDTDLSRLYVKNVQHEIFSPEKAAELLFGVMTKTKENGVFLDYAGKSIPW